ncbi:M23 family peptidase [Mycolicibacterium moriokaense]|nr:M23 family peptidase [Mycolicibacterium moriokaense]
MDRFDESSRSPATSSAPDVPVAVTPVLASVVSAPIPVPATDGKTHLAYELQLTNVMTQQVSLDQIDVLAGDQTLLSLTGDQVAYWTHIIGTQAPTSELGPGQAALVWLDVALDSSVTVPTDLVHSIEVAIPKPSPPLIPAKMDERVAPVTVQTRKPAVIAPPLDGPNWLDGDSCCDMTAHRTALNALSGGLWGAERFAIDYVQLQPDGTIFTGDRSRPQSYPYFGADIHAVADGPVVGIVDGLPEQVAGRSPTGLSLEEYGGNHIVQDIGDGNYAFYAHLKTGSLKVKVGDKLTTGQVIAALGNTGNSDAPHLHFHVMSTPDPLRSDGLPFVFSKFRLDGRLASQDALDPVLQGKPAALQPGFTARDESDVSPLVLDVMTYETQ